MTQSIFETGYEQDIAAVLNNRDQRSSLQKELMDKFVGQTVIATKLNIPGPIKNNDKIHQLFEWGNKQFLQMLESNDGFKTLDEIDWDLPTGPESFRVTSMSALQIKKIAIDFEDSSQIGRLFDIDVLNSEVDEGRPISRTELEMPVRNCLICDRPAKECARSRRHSVSDLQEKISSIYAKQFN
ncbi:citrate lyase holo-[acyl-carrier protein] synthase [Pediococcus claussenii]|uniref:citrate lyase holo-[acyl-carrier protein] synthase n=1 Tax=Pediococcus claussenii (strain ATCC BAA-344 / DSM 14800 / JCM 18046 / KCTC 3811 / LMG 21948 / P06) TaxID=701521 RepID=G8PAM1_PEDCP|nr:citrate lyase holo-[acyl-carrier protein] synthase [Pediococcus claussenii]AEV94580.1 holo-ACP synthase CitX [Pediococcus claussenii ATCC BAA-344]ANZ69791.1 phosphoribosyl-dephospho-CoA transferase [Pediococcus claussenii]ANZ71608.1 phosphoribosyl-dephospho-CoA transferase [Pediococcus claussenii]KRN19714.1 citX protein [Pediococcus claussenii]